MINSMDVKIELLGELNEICKTNGLKYILGKKEAFTYRMTKKLPDELLNISVYMAAADFLEFEKIVRNRDDRFVEFFLNNMNQRKFSNRFGNTKTTYVDLRNLRKHKKNGIFISIRIIEKPQKSKLKNNINRFLRGFWTAKNKSSNRGRVGIKHFLGVICGIITSMFGEERISKHIYNYIKKNFYVETWEDIFKYKYVICDGKKVHTNIFKELEEHQLNNVSFTLPQDIDRYLTDFYGENFHQRRVEFENKDEWTIVDTEISYKDTLEVLENEGFLQRYYDNLDEQLRILARGSKYRKVIKKSWNVYLMTREWYDLKSLYKCRKDGFKKFLHNEDYKALYNEFKPFWDFDRKWGKRKIPYISIKNIDDVGEIIDNMEFKNAIDRIEESEF